LSRFIYGSLVNKLHWKYRQSGLNVLGLSTAFEDFEYNTAANTELLLTEMKLVGATRQALGEFTLKRSTFPLQSIILPQVQHSQHLKTLKL